MTFNEWKLYNVETENKGETLKENNCDFTDVCFILYFHDCTLPFSDVN